MGFKIVNTGIQEKQEFLVILLHFSVKKNSLFLRKDKEKETESKTTKITETVETLSESRLSKSANKGGTSSWNPRGLKSMDGGEGYKGENFGSLGISPPAR